MRNYEIDGYWYKTSVVLKEAIKSNMATTIFIIMIPLSRFLSPIVMLKKVLG
jgi:hypothetical protein